MEIAEEIRKIAESKLADPSHFVVDVVASLTKSPRRIMVILDGDNSITIDDCANLSRELSGVLEENGLAGENYLLEVSTPGLDHPLKLKRQYKKNIGRGVKVKLQDKQVEGKLTGVTEDNITLEQEIGKGKKKEIQTVEIQFSEIEKTFVLVSFK
ncbi:MAG: ribosome maturation factor RimP [Chryseolinea sp.]